MYTNPECFPSKKSQNELRFPSEQYLLFKKVLEELLASLCEIIAHMCDSGCSIGDVHLVRDSLY